MTTITLDVAAFRAMFTRFGDVTAYPDACIQIQFDAATTIVSPETGCVVPLAARTRALYLVTAHLLTLDAMINAGGTPGIVTGSKVGDVSVTLAAPPYGSDSWRYWLNLTPYGQQLLALLKAQTVGGFVVGGNCERDAFRRVGGDFGPPCELPCGGSSDDSGGVPFDDGILWD